MAGKLYSIMGKTALDYTFLAATPDITLVRKKALRLTPYYHYWLGVRVHNKNISTGTFLIQAWETLPTSTDPQEFLITPAFMTITVNSGTTAPALLSATGSNRSPWLKFTVLAGNTAAGNPLYAELSIVLLARAA
jgi:hypothetical protein